MRFLLWLAAALLVAGVAAAAYVRLARDDPARWHVDPLEAPDNGRPNMFRIGPGGGSQPMDAAAPVYDRSVDALAAAFDAMALAQPRTIRLAGSPTEGLATYVQRSRFWRFPDYVSVRFIDLGEGRSTLAIYSRSRYGSSDLGVNRARVEAWLAELQAD